MGHGALVMNFWLLPDRQSLLPGAAITLPLYKTLSDRIYIKHI
ncbi:MULTISPECIES: hypothetical protein [Nostoc]|nr:MULTISPECIES: hypothetical protein [Nostoc]